MKLNSFALKAAFHLKKCISSKICLLSKFSLYEYEIVRVIIVPNLIIELNRPILMTCKECGTKMTQEEYDASYGVLGVSLCERHTKLIKRIILNNNTPLEAIQLYYALKERGAQPMLEWWDGNKSVDIAFSRVKLNIEIDTEYDLITHEQALKDLEESMHSFKNGFTTIRIPHLTVKYYLDDTVENILGIISSLKANIKVI